MDDESTVSNRTISVGVAAGVVVFALLVAIGSFLRSRELLPGALILGCALAFLMLWHLTRYRLAQRRISTGTAAAEGASRLSMTCVWSCLLAALAWVLAVAGDLLTLTSTRAALLLLGLTATACLAGFMLAVIGISSPTNTSGKGLGIVAVAATSGLVLLAVVRLVLGM
jgi:hypothetical protein